MSFFTRCPECGARYLRVPASAAGQPFQCRNCKRSFEVVIEAEPEEASAPAEPAAQPRRQAPPATVMDPAAVNPPATVVAPTPSDPPATVVAEATGDPPPTAIAGAGQQAPAPLVGQGEQRAPATMVDPGGERGGPPPTVIDEGAGSPDEPDLTLVDAGATRKAQPGSEEIPLEQPPRPPQPPSQKSRWQTGDVVLGLYEVTEILGVGGMGTVYRVHHRGWDVDLAVKSPLASVIALPGGAESFEREAETWVNLGLHPNIVSCFYVRRIDGVPCLFAEYVDGGSLYQRIRNRELRDMGEILDIAIQLAWGLHYAHEIGLVHQDVKPANVMLASTGLAKITDFGLARAGLSAGPALPALATGTHSVLVSSGGMTPAYCSPEQQSGAHLTRRTDIWSWAVTMLEIFAGEVTWRSGAVAPQVLEAYQDQGPVDDRIPPMPEPIAELLTWCWQSDPGQRPDSMEIVADRLAEIYRSLVGSTYPRQPPRAGRDTADSLNNRAVSLLDLGREDEAERLWRQAGVRQAHHIETTYNSAVHAWRHGVFTDDEILLRMHELRRTSTATVRDEHLLGKIHLALADYDKAFDVLSDALTGDPDNEEIARDRALARCGVAAEADSDEGWQDLQTSLTATLDLHGEDPRILTGFAAALQHTGHADEAEAFYVNARSEQSDLPLHLSDAMTSFLPGANIVHRWQVFSREAKSSTMSRDGRLVAAVGDGHALYVWFTSTGEAMISSREASKKATAVALSPGGDTLVVAAESEPLSVWDPGAGRRVHALQPHQGSITCLAFAGDSSVLAGGSTDRRLRLWDMSGRTLIRSFEGHTGAITAVATSHDGEILLSGSLDHEVRLWEATSGACRLVLGGHQGTVRSVTLSEDNRFALSAGDDGTVRLWNLERGECKRTLRGHARPVTSVSFCRDDRWALTASADGSIRLWELDTGSPSVLSRFSSPVSSFLMADDESVALVSSGDALMVVRLFDRLPYRLPYAISVPVSSEEAVRRQQAYDSSLENATSLFRSDQHGAAIEELRRARSVRGFERAEEGVALWREVIRRYPRQGLLAAWERSIFEHAAAAVTALCVMGDRAVIGLADGTTSLIDLATTAELCRTRDHDNVVSSVAFAAASALVVSASWDQTVMVRDGESLAVTACLRGHGDYVLAARPLPDHESLLSAGSDGTFRLWRYDSEGVSELLDSRDTSIPAVAVGPDGCLAVTGGWDNTLRLWDVAKRRELAAFEGHEQAVAAVDVSPDGSGALSGGHDRTVRMWDLKSGRCLRLLKGHEDEVTSVAFAPDGRFAASGSKDGTARLWDIRESVTVRTFEGHTGPVSAVAFDEDGTTLLTGGHDGSLRQWHLDWDPSIVEGASWDERARPYLEIMLHRRLELDPLPPQGDKVTLSSEDLATLRGELARRGFGWIAPATVREKLQESADSWRGATSTWRGIRSAHRKQAAATRRRQRALRVPMKAVAAGAAALLLLATLVIVVAAVSRVDLNDQEVDAVARQTSRALDPNYVSSFAAPCTAADHDLYLEWCLDPLQANQISVTCLCRVATARTVIALLDSFRDLQARAAQDPEERMEATGPGFITLPDDSAITFATTVAEELERIRRLALTVFTTIAPDELDILGDYLGDQDPAIRSLVADALASRNDHHSGELLMEAVTSRDGGRRLAVAAALPELIVNQGLSGRRAFALAKALCRDSEPPVRARAVQALSLFADRKALDLARELAQDADGATADAASEVADTLERRIGG